MRGHNRRRRQDQVTFVLSISTQTRFTSDMVSKCIRRYHRPVRTLSSLPVRHWSLDRSIPTAIGTRKTTATVSIPSLCLPCVRSAFSPAMIRLIEKVKMYSTKKIRKRGDGLFRRFIKEMDGVEYLYNKAYKGTKELQWRGKLQCVIDDHK